VFSNPSSNRLLTTHSTDPSFNGIASANLDATLLGAHLIDELRLWIMPVVVGTGQRLFEDVDTSSLHLQLAYVRKLEGGSAIHTYLPS
jgi:dihydrofolate reductase